MRTRQRGVTLSGLLIGAFILVILALLGMKLAPSYMEYNTIRKAVTAVAAENHTSVNEIRKAFDRRQAIDDFQSVKAADLEITKDGGSVVISFSYRREVPLFANIGLYFDFTGGSKERE